jgi:glycerol-3-phosphate dehydrogenase (NAD(P)+)
MRDIPIVLLVTPAQATRAVLKQAGAHLQACAALILCAKGIEQKTGMFLTQVVADVAPWLNSLVLSGPSFAGEVARGLPAAVTLASEDIDRARMLARLLSHKSFRIYSSDDPLGVQIGGAMKNVLAIACGIVEGKQLGESARAALLTRAFAELSRFGRALGAKVETLMGLSGLGDLMLTATSSQSRNYSLGVALGRGQSLADILKQRITIAEGVHTAQVAVRIAREHGIDMPICEAVHAIVSGASTPDAEIERLLTRPLKDETIADG